jgi:hypothetical protein
MRAGKAGADVSLATLTEAIVLAQCLAQELQIHSSPSHADLTEALMCAHISVLRLVAEVGRARRRGQT